MPALAKTALAHLPAPARWTCARRRPCLLGRAPGRTPPGRDRAGVARQRRGRRPALVLGPLAVDPSCRGLGAGAALVNQALAAAEARGHGAVILLGDAPYYARFGFSALQTGEHVAAASPLERERLLGLELRDGALDGAWRHDRRRPARWRPKSAAPRAHAGAATRTCTRPERHHGGVPIPTVRDAGADPRVRRHRHHHPCCSCWLIMIVRDVPGRAGGAPATAVAVRRDRYRSPLDRWRRGCDAPDQKRAA